LRKRVIPVLLLRRKGLVKSVRFGRHNYIGDPINAVRIFNEKEVDELSVIDIDASAENREPDFESIREIVSEAFMPVSYGGGVHRMDQVQRLLANGVEKVIVNTASFRNPSLITEASKTFGSQSIVVCIDHRKSIWGRQTACMGRGKSAGNIDPVTHARRCEELGAGEVVLQSIDRDGTYSGYDLEMIRKVSSAIGIPLVALGGASRLEDFKMALESGASAVAAGSLFVYHGSTRGVLINYPRTEELSAIF
jgi:cyclase